MEHARKVLVRLRALSYEPDRARARAEAAALQDPEFRHLPPQLRMRLNSYALLSWLEGGGALETAPALAKAPPQAVFHINELVLSGLPHLARQVCAHYAATWPSHDALAKWDRLTRRMDASGPVFRDELEADVQVVRRPGARSVLFVFAGLAHAFGMPLTTFYRCWLSALEAHVVFLRDFDNCLYVGGVRSLGDHAATAARMREMAAELGAEHVATVGFSAGNFGALYYGAMLEVNEVVAFAGPTSLDIGLRFPNKQAYGRILARHQAGELPWPDVRSLLAERPHVRVQCFYSERNRPDALQAQNLLGLPNVEVVCIPESTDHFTLDRLEAEGRLMGILQRAAGEG